MSDEKPGGAGNPRVLLRTSHGDIVLELLATEAPVTTDNFLAYVREGFYDGTIFHRVIPGFMVQGGGFTPDLRQKPAKDPIANEATNGLANERGTVAMARTMQVHSATSQFFINLADNDFLDHRDESPQGYGYAVFGRVVEGMEVVDDIAAVETTTKPPHQDVPVEDVIIREARLRE
ncbi:MAG: peptidylprolyl isomerase [Thermoleophilia bacterium]